MTTMAPRSCRDRISLSASYEAEQCARVRTYNEHVPLNLLEREQLLRLLPLRGGRCCLVLRGVSELSNRQAFARQRLCNVQRARARTLQSLLNASHEDDLLRRGIPRALLVDAGGGGERTENGIGR